MSENGDGAERSAAAGAPFVSDSACSGVLGSAMAVDCSAGVVTSRGRCSTKSVSSQACHAQSSTDLLIDRLVRTLDRRAALRPLLDQIDWR